MFCVVHHNISHKWILYSFAVFFLCSSLCPIKNVNLFLSRFSRCDNIETNCCTIVRTKTALQRKIKMKKKILWQRAFINSALSLWLATLQYIFLFSSFWVFVAWLSMLTTLFFPLSSSESFFFGSFFVLIFLQQLCRSCSANRPTEAPLPLALITC